MFHGISRGAIFETVLDNGQAAPIASTRWFSADDEVYQIGFVTKVQPTNGDKDRRSDKTRDTDVDRRAINEATTQVLRGASGLINHLYCVKEERSPMGHVMVLPVIFTSAELWVSEVDLKATDLATGRIKTDKASPVPWLWFNHNQSPDLLHELARNQKTNDLAEALRIEYCRTIAVVSASGIDEFLLRKPPVVS